MSSNQSSPTTTTLFEETTNLNQTIIKKNNVGKCDKGNSFKLVEPRKDVVIPLDEETNKLLEMMVNDILKFKDSQPSLNEQDEREEELDCSLTEEQIERLAKLGY